MKYFSEIEHYEIININDGEKYGYVANNDIIIDEDGYLKLLILNERKSHFSFFNGNNIFEVPWQYVKKIGSKTLIIDIEEEKLKKIHY